jgi:hypothetical protein
MYITEVFPRILGRGLVRRRRQAANIVDLANGDRQAEILWAEKHYQWDASISTRPASVYTEQIRAWWDAVDVGDSFPLIDEDDYTVGYSQGLLQQIELGAQVGTAGLGYGGPLYQMLRRSTKGSKTLDKRILKPSTTGFATRIATVVSSSGAGADQYTLSTTAGTVTFGARQSKAVNTHVVGADHKFTLASAFSPNVTVGQRVWVTGVTGTAADTLNGQSHEVTVVSSADVTVATSTAGLTATGGTVALYPQANEALDWKVDLFYFPVSFRDDVLEDLLLVKADAGLLIQVPAFTLIECINPDA